MPNSVEKMPVRSEILTPVNADSKLQSSLWNDPPVALSIEINFASVAQMWRLKASSPRYSLKLSARKDACPLPLENVFCSIEQNGSVCTPSSSTSIWFQLHMQMACSVTYALNDTRALSITEGDRKRGTAFWPMWFKFEEAPTSNFTG